VLVTVLLDALAAAYGAWLAKREIHALSVGS
jgi:hypothetical protein